MTSPLPGNRARPLSPHLTIYKPQITSGMSIFHRLTGVCLSLGLPVLVWWLVSLAQGQESYASFVQCAHSPVGQILLMGWSWAFFYHLCCGIRHLFWDAGLGLSIKQVYRSGYIALGVSTFLTLCLWARMWSGFQ
jgi:succinate dehydrogenase / fumarate reductase, cytochrome b subunit